MTDPTTTVTTVAEGIARIAWSDDEPIDVIRHNVVAALADHARVEALIDPDDEGAQRAATWSGLRREGVMRGVTVGGAPVDRIVYARLATDTPLHEPEGFRALLNSFLPRKRAIGQMLIRDHDGRVLLCSLTYKTDWDLPGGVVEVNEAPREAVAREIEEELGLEIPAGPLVLTDWLPAWSGWDDALCLVFDGGRHDAALTDTIVREAREIRTAEFCTVDQVHERCADFTARRIEAALANLAAGGGPAYTESGR
ncbi:NUDIX domain-containing protein [Nocardioides sp. LMS-CY]|uniref:8-oxo-dGTP pyrophosphatase MutT (NUDIX family) n=1 Tax=Nocardioides soli TaxID=1036020 RepID=A0A7W4VXR3_9ACTN|nr:NUDIX domain-containing protein [Nocardioides sp. LMS-CY]MBB3043675.1 8-oxo-dGTP pyrophosphatase MutT (NUDIX family) [Nocardioides soli]QWF20821.1 NUDIX domain-containing protein [Nocardioides sp. LMS-CY]